MSKITNIKEYGKCVANQGEVGFFTPVLCDTCGHLESCQDKATVDALQTYTGFVYEDCDKKQHTITFAAPVAAANLQTAIAHALSGYEVDIWVRVKPNLAQYDVLHRGQGAIVSITGTSSVITATRNCVTTNVCEYKTAVEYGATFSTITVDGTPYGFAAQTAANGTSAVAVAAITPALPTGTTVSIVDDSVVQVWHVSVMAEAGKTVLIGTAEANECNCTAKYL